MAPRSNFMADIAQMANGAASAFGGMREELDNLIRQRMERSLNARGRAKNLTRFAPVMRRLRRGWLFSNRQWHHQLSRRARLLRLLNQRQRPSQRQKRLENNQRFEPTANQRIRREKHNFMWVMPV